MFLSLRNRAVTTYGLMRLTRPSLQRWFATEESEKSPEEKQEESEDEKKKKEKLATMKLKKNELKKKYASNPSALMEFFDDYDNWGEDKVRTGREWFLGELRIKSNEDLHKLWYVLLKERNMLMTMREEAKEQVMVFPNPERLDRVETSMANIETVVRERNKAYWQLEVGEQYTGARPMVFRRDLFGRHMMVGCHQHTVPYFMSKKYRKLYGPGFGSPVDQIVQMFKEKNALRRRGKTLGEWQTVRQLLRRFPDIDLAHLQEKYPRVPVQYLKDNESFYLERTYIDRVVHKYRYSKLWF